MAAKTKTEAKDVSIRIDIDLRDRLKIYAIRARVGFGAVANQAIEEFLKRNEKVKP